MRPFAHRASIVVSGLLGAALLWTALRAPEPAVVEEMPAPAPEVMAEVPELPKVSLAADVVLPPPPVAKATPKPEARPEPKPAAKAEPKPRPAPQPKPEPKVAPQPAPEPVAQPVPDPAPPPVPVAEAPAEPAPIAEAPVAPEPAAHPAPQAPAAMPEPAPVPLKPLKPTIPPREEKPAPAPLQVRPLQPSPPPASAREVTSREPVPEPQVSVPDEPVEAPVVPLRPTPPAERAAPAAAPPVVAATTASPVRPVPRPAPVAAGPTVEVSLRPDTPAVRDGRALLLILEHGAGPGIEIYWPDDRQQRERLYHTLSGCYGMRTALMDGGGRLYIGEGGRGQPWIPSMDRFSGFMRQPQGAVAGQEQRQAASVAQYHGFGHSLRIVRIFPRSVDAALLGGLRTLIGDRYGGSRSIAADYRNTSDGLFVDNIRVDGAPVPGRIAFPAIRGGNCT